MAKRPKIGPLRHRIEVFQVDFSDDPNGGGVQIRTEVSLGTVWSDIKPTSGTEQLNSLALDRPVTHIITIRDQSALDLLSVKQINFGTRTFRVEDASNPDFRKRFIRYECQGGGQLY